MNELVFDATIPITDKGILWDKYYLQTLVITTSLVDNKISLYAEFWLARAIIKEKNIVESKVYDEETRILTIVERLTDVPTFELKTDIKGSEIKSIMIDDIYSDKDYPTELGGMTSNIIALLYKVGIDRGVFK